MQAKIMTPAGPGMSMSWLKCSASWNAAEDVITQTGAAHRCKFRTMIGRVTRSPPDVSAKLAAFLPGLAPTAL
jgi:hypothetical protein